MNAIMLIQIRVASAQAQRELAKVQGQERALAAQSAATAKAARNMSYGLPQLSKWGNQVQWAGRQLQYNFTLPILLAAGAATKFQLDNEKAMTRVIKVYGDAQHSAKQYKTEIDALGKAFEALSNRFGVNQSEVINVAADWAAAGASGIALARATKLTLETMILGEMGAADATKALIAIQAQYGQSTKELSQTIDTLNMIENQTGISMQGLVQGFEKSAGVARSTGIDVQHLGALLAALVPSSGSAATAGQALKTIFSRLLSPTKEAAEVMGMMGIKTQDMAWKSLTASQRLELMAKKYTALSKGVKSNTAELDHNGNATGRMISSQQAIVSTVMASRWQINRWDVLMRDIANKQGYYQKSLNATGDAQGNFNQKVYELNTVLSSNPHRLKQMWTILQNAMADVIQPMILYIVYLAQGVAKMAMAFSKMNPVLQKTILFALLLLAAIGPIARYVGSVTTLFGIMSAMLHFVAARLGLVAVATAVETEAVNMQRKGLLGLIFAWARFPFALIGGGFHKISTAAGGLFGFLAGPKMRKGMLSMAGAAGTAVGATQTIYARGGEAILATQAKFEGTSIGTTVAGVKARLIAEANGEAQRLRESTFANSLLNLKTKAFEAERTFIVDSAGFARVNGEAAEATRRTFIVDSAGNIRVATERANEVQRTLALTAGASARTEAEIASETTRTFTVDGNGTARAAAEAAEAAERTFIVDSSGAARAAYETVSEETRTLALAAGSSARVAAETAAEGNRVFVVNSGAVARAVSEEAAEVRRVIAVDSGGVARVTSEAASAARILAIQAGLSGRMLALSAGTETTRTFEVNGAGMARVASEAASQGARTFEVTSGGVARLAAEVAAEEARIAAVIAFQSTLVGAENAGTAGLVAVTVARNGELAALYLGYYDYLLTLQRASYAASYGLEAAASASRLALTAGASAERLAIESRVAGTEVAIRRSAAVATLAVDSAMYAEEVAMARTAGSAEVAIRSATGVATVGIAQKTAVANTGIFRRMLGGIGGIFTKLGPMLGRAIFSWPGLIVITVAAILGVMYHFRDQIAKIWDDFRKWAGTAFSGVGQALSPLVNLFHQASAAIQKAFWSLPAGIRDAMLAVINIIRQAALAVYEWFSYLNPWAHHSPSLVESVTSGMDAVTSQFARAKNVGGIFAQATRDLHAFQAVAMKMKVADASKDAKGTGAMGARLLADYKALQPVLQAQEAVVARQQAVVDRWNASLDKANARLDTQQAKLDNLQKHLDTLSAAYDRHKDALQNWAAAPLKGMGAMDDALFANSMEQKRLQLQMLQWEKVNGTFDSITSRVAALQGAMELLRAQQSELRGAGAGSDITGPIQDQINALDAQSKALSGTVSNSPMAQWQKQLDDLNLNGQIMELQKSLKFDGPIREIDQLVNGMKEMPFEQIIAGIKREQSAMDGLQPAIDSATAAVEKQQAAVDKATAARDAVQAAYDRESKSLDELNKKYQKTQDLVNGLEQALRSLGSARDAAENAKKAKKGHEDRLTPGGQNFKDAAGGGFPDPGSLGKIGREGGWGNEDKMVEEFAKGLTADLAKSFGSIDIFGPLKKWWTKAWGWIKTTIGPVVKPIWEGIKSAFGNIKNAVGDLWDTGKIQKGASKVGGAIGKIIGFGVKLAKLFGPDLRRIWDTLIDSGKKVWDKLGPEFERFAPMWKGFKRVLAAVAIIIASVVIPAVKIFVTMLTNTLGPVLGAIIDVIGNIIQVFRGLSEFVIGVLTLDFKMAFHGLYDIVAGTFGGIWHLVKGVFLLIWKPIEGFFKALWEIGKWIYDEFIGHSIIPDLINGIFDWFHKLADLGQWIWDHSFGPIIDFAKKLFSLAMDAFALWWEGIKLEWKLLKSLGQWAWDHILKPVLGFFKDLWTKVKDKLNDWWENIKTAWNKLKTLGKWVWDNILVPVFTRFKEFWTIRVKGELEAWWARVKTAWNKLKDIGKWVWDNVLVPAFTRFKEFWTIRVKGELEAWWARIKTAWSALKNLGGWVLENVMNPVLSKIKEGWGKVKTWLEDNKDFLLKPAKGIINGVADAINFVIKGLNKISDILPGIDFHINPIMGAASGSDGLPTGRRVGGGFKTSGARAIVGEGKANYPEYVIPTDPTYRNRARSLLSSAGQKLGVDVPRYSIGGVLGNIADAAKAGGNWAKGNIKKLASAPFAPFRIAANAMLNKAAWDVPRQIGKYGVARMTDWVGLADNDAAAAATIKKQKEAAERARRAAEEAARQVAANGKQVPYDGPSNGWAYPLTRRVPITQKPNAGHRPSWAVDLGAPLNTGVRAASSGRVATAADLGNTSYGRYLVLQHSAGVQTLYAHLNKFAVNRGDTVKTGQTIGLSGSTGGSTGPHLHFELKPSISTVDAMAARGVALAHGGVVRKTQGGVLARIGEGDRDEAVIPLPRNWRSTAPGSSDSGTHKEYHFHGDLSFPNVRTGEDAESFITNLEIVARD